MKEVLKTTLNPDLTHDLDTFNKDDTELNISAAGFGGLAEPDDPRSFLGHEFTQALPSIMSYTSILVFEFIPQSKVYVFGK